MAGDDPGLDMQANSEGTDLASANAGQEVIESEETEPQRTLSTPVMPSKSDMEQHRIDHLPYRDWCPECVDGFGK